MSTEHIIAICWLLAQSGSYLAEAARLTAGGAWGRDEVERIGYPFGRGLAFAGLAVLIWSGQP